MRLNNLLYTNSFRRAAIFFATALLWMPAPFARASGGATVAFTASRTVGPAPLTVNFFAQATNSYGAPLVQWHWNFGDGATSFGQNPSHTYTNNGVFTPSLQAFDTNFSTSPGLGPNITVGPVTNLLTNGGFDLGTFAGWTIQGDTNEISVSSDPRYATNSPFGAKLGPKTFLGSLTQNLATTPGTTYIISFNLDSPDGLTNNEFKTLWNGQTLMDLTNMGAFGWSNVVLGITATTTNTTLQFGYRDDPTYLGLDNVDVEAFTVSPAIQTVECGSSATFSVVSNNLPVFSYQWYSLLGTNYAILPTQTNTSLTVTDLTSLSATAYAVVLSNASGMYTSAVVNVTVVDSTPPTIVLNGSNPMVVLVNSPFVDPGATAMDLCSGTNVTIQTNSNVNTNLLGSYTVTYTSFDNSNNAASATRTVLVVNRSYDYSILSASNLLGYWPFTPSSQFNSVVNGYTGTNIGGATIGGLGSGPTFVTMTNTAVVLNGSTAYVDTSLAGQITNTPFPQASIVGWYKLSALPSSAGHAFVIAGESQTNNDFTLLISTNNFLECHTAFGGVTTFGQALTDLGVWHFVAATFTSSQLCNVYFDGVLVASNTNPGVYIGNSTNQFSIGASDTTPNLNFNGSLSDIAIFNRQLTSAEIASFYNAATKFITVSITSPTNGNSFPTNQPFAFSADADAVNGVQSLALYLNSSFLASATGTNISTLVSNLAPGSYDLTAVATDINGKTASATPVHITLNVPGTTLIDFDLVDASTGSVTGAALNSYLANYGVALSNFSAGSTVAIQDDQNILGGTATVAASVRNLLTQTSTNGAVSYTLSFDQPYTSVSWVRTAILASSGGAVGPEWTAFAFDANGKQLSQTGERQVLSLNTIPAQLFKVSASNITSITFTANNALGSFKNLPLDNLLLSTNNLGPVPQITLTASNVVAAEPGQISLLAQATEAGGAISQINFYENQGLVGLPTSGNNATLTVSSLSPGSYSFYATAADTNGNVTSSTNIVLTVTSVPGVAVINFDDPSLNTALGAVGGVALSNYLAANGVAFTNVTIGTRLEAINQSSFSGNELPMPSSFPNLFTQVGSSKAVTFTLVFATNEQSVTFTRSALLTNGPSSISHPSWTARIFDAGGNELESVGEPVLSSSNDIPARTFTLAGNNIATLRFDSDSQGTAAFDAVLLDDVVLNANSGSSPLSIGLGANGSSFTSPASVILTPSVSDGFSTNFYVAFYSGPNLLGTNGGGNAPFTFTNVLNGNFSLTARVFDSTGYALLSTPVSVAVAHGAGAPLVVNFDPLNATAGPVTGTNLDAYLATNFLGITSNSPGSTVAVENQANVAGGGFVSLSSLSNLLTQLGSNGPSSFTVTFSNLLTQFNFTRPQLVANPSVSHPAWRAVAFDALGQPLESVQEPVMAASTNIPSQNFTLGGGSIASVEFDSSGTGLSTFNSALLDDFVLTFGSASNLPPAVLITNPVAGELFTAAAPITLTAITAPGTGSVTNVSFYFNGTNLAGSAQASPFSIAWNAPSNGSYLITAVAINDSGLSNTSAPVPIVVGNGFAIITPPVGKSIPLGGTVTFTVVASGSNVSYQWQDDGSAIPGATHSSFTITNASVGNDGSYTVVASANSQSITSQPPAVLTVINPPSVTPTSSLQPTVNVGDTVTLSVSATDVLPFTYQWRLNGASIPGATNNFYTISNAQPLNSGNYQVLVANDVAFALSPTFDVAVNFNGGVPSTSNFNFSNSIPIDPLVSPIAGVNSNSPVSGELPSIAGKPAGRFLWYRWTAGFTGVIALTTEGSSYDTLLGVYTGTGPNNLNSVAEDDDSGGFFTSEVSFNCNQGTTYYFAIAGFKGATGTAILGLPFGTGYRVLDPASGDAVPVITQQPSNQIVNMGDTVTLTVQATNATTYQWFFANAPVVGGNSNILVISNFPAGAVGNYYALAANGVGAVQSQTAVIEIATQVQGASTNNPDTLTVDKFGDAVDLTKTGSVSHYRPTDSGGETGGFTLSQSFSTLGATKEAGEPNHAGQPGGASYWYSYTAPAGGSVQFNTAGSSFNTILAIYTGPGNSFSTLVSVGANFTTNYVKNGQPVVLVSNVVSSTKFFIAIDGYQGVSGAAHLNIVLSPSTNLLNTNAIPLTNHNASFVISSPVNNFLTTSSNIVIKGVVRGILGLQNPLVSFVQVAVNGNSFGHAALGATNFAAVLTTAPNGVEEAVAQETVLWSTNLTLVPGANVITAQSISVQNSGTPDATVPVTHTIFYVPALPVASDKSTLTLVTTGNGKITGLANNASLEVNKIYHADAVPAGNWLFTNWTSGTNLTNLTGLPNGPSLSFVMSSNLILQANFVTNPFTAIAGVYNGLFAPSTGVTEASSGFFSATIPAASRGAYSAKVLLDGGSYPFSGTFSLGGDAEAIVNRAGKTPLSLALHVNVNLPTNDNLMTGSITNNDTNNGWSSDLTADRSVFSAKNPDTAHAGRYTLVLPPESTNGPGGYGFATLTNNRVGEVAITGSLADGTPISQSVPISEEGNIPLYVSLYSRKGSLLGWLTVTNNSSNTPPRTIFGNDLTWIKPAGKAGTLYASGFTNSNFAALGAAYVPPSGGASPLALTNGTLTLSNAAMGTLLVYSNLSIAGDKLVVGSGNPPNKLTGVLTPSTGALTITFRPTGARADTIAKGVVLQDTTGTNGAGWFIGDDQSGFFLLQP